MLNDSSVIKMHVRTAIGAAGPTRASPRFCRQAKMNVVNPPYAHRHPDAERNHEKAIASWKAI